MATKPKVRLVPRLGPKVNVRPGGPHESHRRPSRRDVKIALKLQGDFPFPEVARGRTLRGVAHAIASRNGARA